MLDFYQKCSAKSKSLQRFRQDKYTWSDDQANYMSSTATGKAPSKFMILKNIAMMKDLLILNTSKTG